MINPPCSDEDCNESKTADYSNAKEHVKNSVLSEEELIEEVYGQRGSPVLKLTSNCY